MKVSEWQSADQKGLASTVFRYPLETSIAMFPICERCRYYDSFAKIGGTWLFAECLLYVDWLEERPLS